jgi:hypothetical protein
MWPFKRKSAPSADISATGHGGTWQVAQGKLGKDVLFTRFDRKYEQTLGETPYTHMVGIAVTLPHLPTSKEAKVLDEIEGAFRMLLERGSQSVLVGVLTLLKLRQYIFYTAEPDLALQLISKLEPKITSHTLTAHAEPDPDWQFYRTFAMSAPPK